MPKIEELTIPIKIDSGSVSGTNLYNALKEEGFELPPECGDVEMSLPVDGVIQLRYIENLSGDRLIKFANALRKLAKEAGPGLVGHLREGP